MKEVKITVSEPFAAGYRDKNILFVTPVRVCCLLQSIFFFVLRDFRRTNFIGMELGKKPASLAKA